MSFCLSAWNTLASTGRIFMKFYIWLFFENLAKIQLLLKSDKYNIYFTWRPKYIVIISHSILLGMRNVSDKRCRNQTHIIYNNLFWKLCHLWNVEQGRPQMIIWCMRIACWILKATNAHIHTHTHTGCLILIAFPLQQWLHEHISMLCYVHIVCLVIYFHR